jgi:hypothetical protein
MRFSLQALRGREKKFKIHRGGAEARRSAEGRREKPSHSMVYSMPVCNQKSRLSGSIDFFS